MKVESVNSHIKDITAKINEKINGRQLVIWGERNAAYENYLLAKYNISPAFRVFWKSSLCDGGSIRHMSTILGNKESYYIVNWDLTMNKKNGEFLIIDGYKEKEDFLLCGIKTARVPQNSVNYQDENNNTCNYCPPNLIVTFNGVNSSVKIDPNVSIKNQVAITIDSDSSIVFDGRCILKEGSIVVHNLATLKFTNTFFNTLTMVAVNDNASLSIGTGTSIFSARISIFAGQSLTIGSDCMFSRNICILAGDGHAIFDAQTGKRTNYPVVMKNEKCKTIIGDHVWVGYGAIILGGGTFVGDGSIIGAGSVVKGKYPNNCVLAGNPSKIIKKNIAWSRDISDIDISYCNGFANLTQDMEEK